jgi:hypothetical protein
MIGMIKHMFGRHPRERSNPKLETLKLRLKDLQYENERLRNARSGITSQLGPLPISAAIVAGLVSAFTVTGKAHLKHTPAIWALIAFGVMVIVSITYSALQPYRKLREKAEEKQAAISSGRACSSPSPCSRS